jgi:hypothetical protein
MILIMAADASTKKMIKLLKAQGIAPNAISELLTIDVETVKELLRPTDAEKALDNVLRTERDEKSKRYVVYRYKQYGITKAYIRYLQEVRSHLCMMKDLVTYISFSLYGVSEQIACKFARAVIRKGLIPNFDEPLPQKRAGRGVHLPRVREWKAERLRGLERASAVPVVHPLVAKYPPLAFRLHGLVPESVTEVTKVYSHYGSWAIAVANSKTSSATVIDGTGAATETETETD